VYPIHDAFLAVFVVCACSLSDSLHTYTAARLVEKIVPTGGGPALHQSANLATPRPIPGEKEPPRGRLHQTHHPQIRQLGPTVSPPAAMSNASIILILAYMRTGSTFTGDILKQITNSYYIFEPYRTIENTFARLEERHTKHIKDKIDLPLESPR